MLGNTSRELYQEQAGISRVQNLINIFVFFLAFPCINVLGNSITFYIFIILILRLGLFWQRPFKGKPVLFSLMAVILLSTILAPYDKMFEHPGFLSRFQIAIQAVYWILVTCFFIVYRNMINIYELARSLFWALMASFIGYFILPISLNYTVADIDLGISRNSFVFDTLAVVPIISIYVFRKFKARGLYAFLIVSILAMFLSNGRSGSVIILLESIMVLAIYLKPWRGFLKFAIVPMIVLNLVSESSFMQPYMAGAAETVRPLSPRFADLLIGENEGDLTMDKSWLIRKLMIDKSFEIFKEYPILGIGIKNFVYYDSELATYADYERLTNKSKDFYNTRSTHNSYMAVLSEFGIIGFILFIWILIIPLWSLAKIIINNYSVTLVQVPLISILGISLHYYSIAAVYGAISWMIFGLGIAATIPISRKK